MQIKTEKGIAESMPLSDLQENNILIRKYFKYFVIWLYILLALIIMFLIYIKKNNILNNIVANCL